MREIPPDRGSENVRDQINDRGGSANREDLTYFRNGGDCHCGHEHRLRTIRREDESDWDVAEDVQDDVLETEPEEVDGTTWTRS